MSTLLADARGFLWVGTTTGLSRFDGTAFRSFAHESGLAEPQTVALAETPDGELWVLTRRRLWRIDPGARPPAPSFVEVPVADGKELGLAATLHVDAKGVLWLGAERGLFRLERGGSAPILHAVELPFSSEQRWATALVEDREGGLWIGTYGGLFHRAAGGEVRRWSVAPAGPDERDDRILDLQLDGEGRLWIATAHGAVIVSRPREMTAAPAGANVASNLLSRAVVLAPALVDSAESEVSLTAALPLTPGGSAHLRLLSGAVPSLWLTNLLAARDGSIWMASASNLFHLDGEVVRRFGPREGMLDHPISALAEDRSGGLWIGTSGGGVARWSRRRMSVIDSFGDQRPVSIGAIFDSSDGADLLVAGRAGERPFLAVRRGETLVDITPRAFREAANPGWGWNQVFLQDREGEWWIPTGEGILRYPRTAEPEELREAQSVRRYTVRDGLPANETFRLFEDSRGDLWISSLAEVALSRWRREEDRIETFPAVGGFARGAPTAFAEGPPGVIWAGLYRGGLARIAGSEIRFFGLEDGLLEGLVSDLLLDRRGRLWVAGFSGLTRLDDVAADAPRFHRVSSPAGRWDSGVRGLAEDDEGAIYIGSDLGVDRYEPDSGRVTHFTTADGLGSNLTTVAHRDARGTIWIGARRGLSGLEPARPSAALAPPEVRIVGLTVDGAARPLSPLGEVRPPAVAIGSNVRRVEVAFAGLSAALSSNVRYQFRIDGLDRDWSVPSAARSVSLAGLAPGRHTLRIRALDLEGVASPAPAEVELRVQAPLWRRAWFLALLAILTALAAWAAHRWRVRRLLALERVRSGIAADLHDDLGSSLARISLLAGVGRMRAERGEAGAGETLAEVGEIARELSEATSDIVWSIDPRRDDLASLVTRLRRFALDLLEGQGIAVEFDATALPPKLELAPERRRDLFLLLKEAIHNVAKHSRARRVEIRFAAAEGELSVDIVDDGVGFSPEAALRDGAGNGLLTMRRRVEAQRGSMELESTRGRGTRLSVRLPR